MHIKEETKVIECREDDKECKDNRVLEKEKEKVQSRNVLEGKNFCERERGSCGILYKCYMISFKQQNLIAEFKCLVTDIINVTRLLRQFIRNL